MDGILKFQRTKMLKGGYICFNTVILLPQDFQQSLPTLLWNRHTPVHYNSMFLHTALLNLLQVQQGVMEDRLTIFPHGLVWAWTLFVPNENRRLSRETVQTRVFTSVAGLNFPDREIFSVNIFLCNPFI